MHKFSKEDGLAPNGMILPYTPFEIVTISKEALQELQITQEIEVEIALTPGNKKIAYGIPYELGVEDLEIELANIRLWEKRIKRLKTWLEVRRHRKEVVIKKHYETYKKTLREYKSKCKYHYRRAVAIISPEMALGWNRWSEDILHLFVSEKMHKVIWGSGNCGKSATMALLLYIKWRVAPDKRMVVVVSKVVTEASERIPAYIRGIHAKAGKSEKWNFSTVGEKEGNVVSTLIWDNNSEKWIVNDRGRIVHLPVKVGRGRRDSGDVSETDIGSNLLGKHPDDSLVLVFDEAQEHSRRLREQKIFLNWYTNPNVEVHVLGNPIPVEVHNPDSWDLLFSMGAPMLGREGKKGRGTELRVDVQKLREFEKKADKTIKWGWDTTDVVHLSMKDSPKDDESEKLFKEEWHRIKQLIGGSVDRNERLEFLAGEENVNRILHMGQTSESSPGWYSQVLGFPFLLVEGGGKYPSVLTPSNIKMCQEYPLIWKDEGRNCKYFMGVDPAITGTWDDAVIVVGKMGMMMDGRIGVDLENGKYCVTVEKKEGESLTDTIIETMWGLSQELGIRLKDIAVETHSSGEVLRYALQKHIETGKWKREVSLGETYYIVSPIINPTERLLFKHPGALVPAKDIVSDCNTEYWVAVRCAVLNRQIFNIPEDILRHFYTRYLLSNFNGVKFKLESKEALRKRGVRSPNSADALCIMFDLLRERGFQYRFYNRYGYTEVYGADYEARQERYKIAGRLGKVSAMLGLNENLQKYSLTAEERAKLEGRKVGKKELKVWRGFPSV